ALQGHVDTVLCMDWSPNGFHLASGASDHAVRIWDLRKTRQASMLTADDEAHAASPSSWLWHHQTNGSVLATCGYDGSLRLSTQNEYKSFKTYRSLENKITGMDLSPSGTRMIISSYDKSLKLYGPDL
ncbi:WD40 repeat-like protein, partial [Caulochytrium protostelioides]